MRKARAALALLLAFAVSVRAETTTDPLWYLLSTYVLAPDERAMEAGGDEADAKGLAGLQADLLLLADGFEAFRDESQVQETLAKLEERMSPELRPFFKTRATSLDAIYRTLAVTDYTWSLRFPDPPCAPADMRAALLSAKDGLFADEEGEASPWLVSLLGEKARGKAAAQALDLASSKTRLSAADYEKRRALARQLSLALASEKAQGAARAGLYCRRAVVYEELAGHHRSDDTALILAARGAARSRPEESVFVVVNGGRRAAATLVKTPVGAALLTDAAAVEGTDEARLFSYGSEDPVKARVLRRGEELGLALLGFEGERQALSLSDSVPEKDALVTALGHTQVSGLWTETSGLVTKTDAASFQTDAAISNEFTGGPALDESGRVAGILVARSADTEEGRWPVAVPAPVIARWVEDAAATPAPTPAAGTVEDAGTAAILSRASPHGLTETALPPMIVPGLPPPPPTPRGVCVSGCNIPTAPSPSRSYSRSSPSPSTSYSGSGGAEMGQAIGEAMAPLVQALVFQGIPALFRGIGKLFNRKAPRREAVAERPREPEKPKEPPKITGVQLSLDRRTLLEGERIAATAVVSFSEASAKKDGIAVSFSAEPGGKATPVDGQPGNTRRTDSTGRATITYELSYAAKERERPFDALAEEEQRLSGEEPVSRVLPQRQTTNEIEKVKARGEEKFDSLDAEEAKVSAEEALAVHEPEQAPGPLVDTAAPSAALPVKMEAVYALRVRADVEPGGRPVAQGAKLGDDAEASVQGGSCPRGMVAVMAAPEPPGGSPGSAPRIDPLKAKQLLECKEIEDRIMARCGGDLACEARELRQERYFEQGCESRWRRLSGLLPGSAGVPNIARRSGEYWCLPANARTARGATTHLQRSGDGTHPENEAKMQSAIKSVRDLMKQFKDYLAVLKEERLKHILFGDGDGLGGGHKGGLGKRGKSEFPVEWSDAKTERMIREVANDPMSSADVRKDGRITIAGSRGGIDIEVILQGGAPTGRYGRFEVITAYPTNTPRNP